MKGIILAGGTGTRLFPVTMAVSKQLLPIYDKPMIYYSLSLLLMAGIRDILVITTPADQEAYRMLLGDGRQFGISLEYATQSEPKGIADAFLIGSEFINGDRCALVLGDNFLYGSGLQALLRHTAERSDGAMLLSYGVKDPERYGIVGFDRNGKVTSIEEKPARPKSNQAVIGIYFYDDQVVDVARQISPSDRGELEITSVNEWYLRQGTLHVEPLGRGYAWLDAGTHEALIQVAEFVRTIEERQGLKIGCLEEIAYRMGYIDLDQVKEAARVYKGSSYGEYLDKLAGEIDAF